MMFGTLWALILEAEDLTHLQFSDVSCQRLNRWAEVCLLNSTVTMADVSLKQGKWSCFYWMRLPPCEQTLTPDGPSLDWNCVQKIKSQPDSSLRVTFFCFLKANPAGKHLIYKANQMCWQETVRVFQRAFWHNQSPETNHQSPVAFITLHDIGENWLDCKFVLVKRLVIKRQPAEN